VWFPDNVGAVTGVVGAAGGLGGFFPPLVMGVVKSATGGYALGFALMALVAGACLLVLRALRTSAAALSVHPPDPRAELVPPTERAARHAGGCGPDPAT
jgi:nitrate/nitrite transporter NarK